MEKLITYRAAVADGIAREMRRDPSIALVGEDVGAAGHVFKITAGLWEEFGPDRVRDTPISEQGFLGMAMGAAMTGMPTIADLMFADFAANGWPYIANEAPKIRYMTGGQIKKLPLVMQFANGGGLGFGAQHSQAIESWLLTIPGIRIVAPSTPADATGLMASAIRAGDPVAYLAHKALLATKGAPAPPDHVVPLGEAAIRREGHDVTLVALAWSVPLALQAAEQLEAEGISAEVIDLRCLNPLDTRTVKASVAKTNRLVIVEENPYQGGWGATLASLMGQEAFTDLDAPITRIAAANVPIPFADILEQQVLPSIAGVTDTVRSLVLT
ncbi:alpha-ketoacid dehydrogenase subunit beta [Streptomyces sp. 7N604]|uniref:alpha-ketoacid dehydrogenase subunit beta n=1 Tax=Streptomyces sp. 7N604 TaxID=3457415 RepID=UPI003FCF66AF